MKILYSQIVAQKNQNSVVQNFVPLYSFDENLKITQKLPLLGFCLNERLIPERVVRIASKKFKVGGGGGGISCFLSN